MAERVKTYQLLQQLVPEYNNLDILAEALSLSHKKTSHQKISQDFQAEAVLRKLQPYGFTLASHLPPSAVERQQGTALPEYHAVLIHQAMVSLVEQGAVTEEAADEKMAELANLIAPLSQAAAKELLEQVKAGEQPAHHSLQHIAEEIIPVRHAVAGQHNAPRSSKGLAKRGKHGGVVTCGCCGQPLMLIHRKNGTHQVKQPSFPLGDQEELPSFTP